jgi:F420-dependent oxidoreductase-like protein
MRIGLGAGTLAGGSVDLLGQVEEVRAMEADGFNHINATDSLIAIAVAGQQTGRIEFVTGVIPIYSRQPLLMAQQALTTQEAAGGRLALGIGLAHPETVPRMWNSAFDRPAHFMQEYLDVLLPLLQEKEIIYSGDMIITEAALQFPEVPAPSVLLAALAPRMLRMAGAVADGTVLWVTGAKAIRTHIAPRINEAADAADRPAPRICAALPMCVTDDASPARDRIKRNLGGYGRLVNYRRVLDIEGVDGPQDVSVVGNEAEAEEQLRELADAGATDFFGALVSISRDDTESIPRSREFLKSMVGKI